MEEKKLDDQIDYWLIQYQRLMDRKPQSLIHQASSNWTCTSHLIRLLKRLPSSQYVGPLLQGKSNTFFANVA